MWSSTGRLTVARRLALPYQTTQHRALPLTQYFNNRQHTNEFSHSSQPRYFLDPKKLYALSERLGKKPMSNYPQPFREFLIYFVARTDQLKEDIERNNREAVESGRMKEEDIDSINRWAFTIAAVLFVLTPVALWYAVKWLIWGRKEDKRE